jgi:DNA-binding response OmpR family regulator
VFVQRLRRKLGDTSPGVHSGQPHFIRTEWGVGYQLLVEPPDNMH